MAPHAAMRALFGIKDRAQTAMSQKVDALNARLAAGQTPFDVTRRVTDPGPHLAAGASSGQLAAVDPTLEHLLKTARSDAVRQEFLAAEQLEGLVDHHQLQLLVATYNVNGRPPATGLDLSDWLMGASDADAVIVGFQEIVPLNANNVFSDLAGTNGSQTAAWDGLVRATLNGRTATAPTAATASTTTTDPTATPASTATTTTAGTPRFSCEGGHLLLSEEPPPSEAPSSVEVTSPEVTLLDATSSEVTSSDVPSAAITSSPPQPSDFGPPPPADASATEDGHAAQNTAGITSSIPPRITSSSPAASDLGPPPAPSVRAHNGAGITSSSEAAEVDSAQNFTTITSSPAAADATESIAAISASGECGGKDGHDQNFPAADSVPAASHDFVQVAAKQMVGIHLSIWVRSSLVDNVRGVQVTSVGTGVMGMLGNKGAVVARLRLFDTGLAVVASHLSSGEAPGDELRRNYDYAEVLRRAAFSSESASISPEDVSTAASEGVSKVAREGQRAGQWGKARGVLDTEHALWLGDLNYRLTGVSDSHARELLQGGKLRHLAAFDELSVMRHTGRAFQGWEEGPLAFPPTFKLQRGTLKYSGSDVPQLASSSMISSQPPPLETQKSRMPAWTDRILWLCSDGSDGASMLKLQSYTSAQLTASDHFPVAARFTLPVRHYNRDRVAAAIEAARRRVDAAEMAAMPRCELEPPCADLGALRLGQCGEADIVLRNIGQVTASFELQPLPGAMLGDSSDKTLRTAPRWASVSPQQGRLEPGASADISIKATVTVGLDGTAQAIVSEGRCRLDAVLVLRISGGNDLFIAISGSYQPSFFGLNLRTLSALPRPLVQQPGDNSDRDSDSGEAKTPKPKFLNPKTLSIETPEAPGAADDRMEFYSPTSVIDSPAGTAAADAEAKNVDDSALESADTSDHSARDIAKATAQRPAQTAEQDGKAGTDTKAEQAAGNVLDGLPRAAIWQQESSATLALVPPEIRALLEYLRQPEALRTPGLFINRADHVTASAATVHSKIVREVREALDESRPIPERAGPHDVGATLLAFFACLPTTFMPLAAVHVCEVCVPTADAAASLLADSFNAVEWAVCRHVLATFRAALSQSDANGLSAPALAALLADAWFGTAPDSIRATGGTLSEAQVLELQRLTASVTEINERRAAFIQTFLES